MNKSGVGTVPENVYWLQAGAMAWLVSDSRVCI